MSAYHYTECGLPNVYLVNGRPSLLIEDIDGLHSAIGKLLVQKTRALAGEDIRFLRTQMNLSQTTLGEQLCVSLRTVYRWEKNQSRVSRDADLSLRLLYLNFLKCPCSRSTLNTLMTDATLSQETDVMLLERVFGLWYLSGQ